MKAPIFPPVPPECNLRGLPWLPVETDRLMNSDLWALSTPEEFKVAFRMWMKAWQQVPAASLPDDDRILAELSGRDLRAWKRLRPMALRGFLLATDGRLYHLVIAEKALEAWKHRLKQRDKAGKRWGKAVDNPVELHAAGDAAAQATVMQGTEKGQGQDRNTGAERTRPAWQAFSDAYRNRYGTEPTRNAPENSAMARFCSLVPLEEAPDIAAFYVGHSKAWYVSHQHSVKYLAQDAAGLRTQWLAGRKTTEAEARSGDRTAARGAAFNDMLAEARARESQ